MSAQKIAIFHYFNTKLRNLRNLGAIARCFNLALSKKESLSNKFIGLDSIKKKIMVLKKINNKPVCCIIDLKSLESCSVKKIYNSISAGSLKTKKLEEFLITVSLQLGFKNSKQPINLKFYENKFNNLNELPYLEAKAKSWENIVSNLLSNRSAEMHN